MNLNQEIVNVAGQPLTGRVGVVTSTSPLEVTVQGTPYTNLGRIGTLPSMGDTVLLLGQAVKGAKTSGSSWVCLGTIVPS